ncbi:MAG: anhydro-N-acetylmuramic acid kinase [Bacteroidota bacterium]|nr:anhydro-N-acetylmuramic acid kinase [Bacteroidota bacterium]
MKIWRMIGMMSGTSLDGVDIAYCTFTQKHEKWEFDIGPAETITYDKHWLETLKQLSYSRSSEISRKHFAYGEYLGKLARNFINKHKLQAESIASHGHTIFHQPDAGYTFQLGEGTALSIASGLPVVTDFRSRDVLLGGQGAPLVPIGDRLLFSEYAVCINLGGFSNCSYEHNHQRIAFDICPANVALNHFAGAFGLAYDRDGRMAAQGRVNTELLRALNGLDFYRQAAPKSLGREWFEEKFLKVFEKYEIAAADKLRTITEHCAIQICNAIGQVGDGKVLLTGGGAKNRLLVKRIRELSNKEIIVPEKKIIDYKEALVFAFLGLLRRENKINCLASVTGARQDSSCGSIFLP